MRRLLKFLPCDLGVTLLVASGLLTAGASVVQGRAVSETEALRRRSLKNEERQEELNAQQQELTRQQELRYVQGEALVNAGNIDPYSSASLLARRRFNQEQAERDVRNIKLNLSFAKGNISNSILASTKRGDAAELSGLLGAGASLIRTGQKIKELS